MFCGFIRIPSGSLVCPQAATNRPHSDVEMAQFSLVGVARPDDAGDSDGLGNDDDDEVGGGSDDDGYSGSDGEAMILGGMSPRHSSSRREKDDGSMSTEARQNALVDTFVRRAMIGIVALYSALIAYLL